MAEAKCSLDWINIGGTKFPYNVMIRAVNSAQKVGLNEDGLLRGFGVLKSHNPKAIKSGEVTFDNFKNYITNKANTELKSKQTTLTANDLVGYDSDASNVTQLLDLLNLDKYRYTEITGETGLLLNNDVIREISYRRKYVSENGPFSHGEVDTMLSDLTKLKDVDQTRTDLIAKRKNAISKLNNGEFTDFDVAALAQIDSVLRIPIDDVIASNSVYEMKQILEQLGQRKKIPTIAGVGTIADLSAEIIDKVGKRIEKKSMAINKPYDETAEREVRARQLLDNPINTDNLNRETTGNFAYNILRKASMESLTLLSLEQLSSLELSRENIENGFINPSAFRSLLVLGSKNKVVKLLPIASKATLTKFSVTKAYSSFRTLFDDLTRLGTTLNTHPAYIIDQFLGNGTGTEWYDTIFNNIGKANQLYLAKLQTAIENKDQLLLDREREFKGDKNQSEETLNNKLVTSNMRVSLFLQKRIGESNVGETDVSQFVENILNKSNRRQYQKKTKDLLETLWNKVEYSSSDEMYNSLSPSEKAIVKFNDDTAAELIPILQQLGVQHGEYPRLLNNYTYTAIMSPDGNHDADLQQFKDKFGTKGYKSGSLKVKQHGKDAVLNILDPLGGIVKAVKMNYMDYYLTPEISQSLAAMTELKNSFRDEGNDAEEITEAVHDLIRSFVERDIRNKLNAKPRDVVESTFKFLERAGYQVQLLSVEKVIGEFVTNVAHAIIARPSETMVGIGLTVSKNKGLGERIIVKNGGVDVLDKLYGESLAGSVHIEKNIFEPGPSRVQQGTEGFLSELVNRIDGAVSVGKGLKSSFEEIGSWAFTTPDRMIANVLFWGTFHSEFQKLSNVELSDSDYDKLANDDDFIRANQDIIQAAMNIAATTVKQSSGAREVYSSIGASQVDPKDPAHAAVYKAINTWMQRFALFEQASMITGVNSLLGQGPLTAQQGVQLIGAGMVRSLLYFPILMGMQAFFRQALGEEDEEDIKWDDEFMYSLMQAMISFSVLRNLHSWPKEGLGWLLESFNKNQLGAIRDGETYDYWKHGIAFRIMSERDVARNQWWKLAGHLSPIPKFITKVNNSKTPFRDAVVGAAAFTGMAPFYKNINTVLYQYDENK